ncbi:MAG: hypothetical protein JXR42_01025 [Gammaproteobacteria bacterium]|nr:hypothetical protein [Gammaproteobacteria bacterium]
MREIINWKYKAVVSRLSATFLIKNKLRSRFYLTNKVRRNPAIYLSSRERLILSLLVDAGDVNRIAKHLNLSVHTVKFYCKTIRQKILLLDACRSNGT